MIINLRKIKNYIDNKLNDYIKKSSTSGYIKNDGTVGTPTDTTYSADETTITKSSGNQFSLKDSSNYIKKNTSTSGYIKNDGTVGTPTGTYTHPSTHAATMITDATKHDNIGSAANATQATINTKIDTALSGKQAAGDYLTSHQTFTQDSGITSNTSGRYAIGTLGSTTIYGKDTNTTYSGATGTNSLGLVKISDSYQSSAGNASQSVAASSKAVNDVYNIANGKLSAHPSTGTGAAQSTTVLKKIKYDANGHITGVADVDYKTLTIEFEDDPNSQTWDVVTKS